VQPIDFGEDVDFVGISVMLTAQIKRGWEIADVYRKKGIKVMFGASLRCCTPKRHSSMLMPFF